MYVFPQTREHVSCPTRLGHGPPYAMMAARPAPRRAATPTGTRFSLAPLDLVVVALEVVLVGDVVEDLAEDPVLVVEAPLVEEAPVEDEEPEEVPKDEDEEPEDEEPDEEEPDEEEEELPLRQLVLPALMVKGALSLVSPVLSRISREMEVPAVMLTVQLKVVPDCCPKLMREAPEGSLPFWTLKK
jgi:pimeloyl-ACP methyl ester carboxylesterase